jgi:hypothetical protein
MEHADLSVDKNFQFFIRFSDCSICGFRLAGQVLLLSVIAIKKTIF